MSEEILMTENYGGTSWSPPAPETAYAPTPGATGYAYGSEATSAEQTSTPQVAKEQASQVTSAAVDAGSEVAGTAVDQGKQVASEAMAQARDLAAEAKAHAGQQVSDQHQKAVASLHGLGDSLHALATGDTQAAPGIATDLAQQAADRVHMIASWIESREPGEILDEARSYARRSPGTFLVGAALAGVLVGRLTRGVVAAQHESTDTASATTPVRVTPTMADPYADVPPSYASSDTFGQGHVAGVMSPSTATTGFDDLTGPDITLDTPVGSQVRP